MPEAVGFFTDTSVCIGCKACEVACKEWNQLKGNKPMFLDSFDSTGKLDEENWRHVAFIDKVPDAPATTGNGAAWLMFSDVCKHCKHASCLEVCPTGAIIRTEFDTVFIQQDVCNGCRDCISACPFGVIGFNELSGTVHKCTFCYDRLQSGLMPACAKVCPTNAIIKTEFDTVYIQPSVCNGCRNCISACPYSVIGIDEETNVARKCTLCYDRLQGGMEPACAKACPTQSIQFGPLAELQKAADVRLAALHSQGVTQAQLYGRDDKVYGGLNAFFLLMDKPEVYGLPNEQNAVLPRRNNRTSYLGILVTAALSMVAGLVAFRDRGEARRAEEAARQTDTAEKS